MFHWGLGKVRFGHCLVGGPWLSGSGALGGLSDLLLRLPLGRGHVHGLVEATRAAVPARGGSSVAVERAPHWSQGKWEITYYNLNFIIAIFYEYIITANLNSIVAIWFCVGKLRIHFPQSTKIHKHGHISTLCANLLGSQFNNTIRNKR